MGVIEWTISLLPAPAADLARSAHLDNPLNLLLVFVTLNLISSLFPSAQPIPSPDSLPDKPTQYNWRPKEHPSPVVWRRWTAPELAQFDGTRAELEEGRLLMAIRRKVYDVSSGKTFYGPGKSSNWPRKTRCGPAAAGAGKPRNRPPQLAAELPSGVAMIHVRVAC